MTTAPPHDLAAALADRYRIERELGRGGMATVYLARDIKHGRLVALKVLHAELTAFLGPERFRREVTLAATLQHPHILTLLDSGETPGGQLWFTMPYVEGESLRERLTREHQLRLDDALRIATEVADALDYAHRHGVIHRDIKPENILLTERHALVADFGIARGLAPGTDSTPRLTETGVALGTPAYMSPEQASADRELDGRSDLYSLACVLYEMLAGEPPFAGPTSQAVLVKRFAGPPPGVRTVRPNVPPAVEDALLQALDPVPASRFATTAQFARALTTAAGSQRSVRSRRVALTVIAGAAFALVAVLAAVEILSRRDAHPSPSVATARTASIAVLPFVNVSSDKENEYFSDGMTEELINALSKVEGLHVAARTSAFAFKGKNEDIAEIGRKLRVANVVEGSVRRAGNRLRVTVELVDATNGYHVWSDRYDRDLKDVFAVQDELARAIVSALRLKLTGGSDSLLANRPTADLVAYDSYLKGRYAWNQRTPSALHQAADYFEQAVARDRRFAQAYAGLADTYVLTPDYGGAPPTETWPKAKAAAERALALDSTLAEAHASLAYGTWKYGRDWRDADREFQRAIALNPSYATGRQWYADYLGGRGRLTESLAEMRRAQALDPLSRVISLEAGRCLYFMHRYDDAAVQIEQTIRLDQNFAASHVWLGLIYLQQGRLTEAVPELQRESDLTGRVWLGMAGLAVVRARSGDRRAAEALLAEITERARHDYVPPTAFAFVYTGMGQPKDAFQWLDTAVDTRDGWLAENFFDPLLDPLRTDPRFAAVEQRMGLDSAHPAPAFGDTPSRAQ